MRIKTKNKLGKIFIWTALIAYGLQIIYLLFQGDKTMLRTGLGNLVLWILLVVGGMLMKNSKRY